MLAPRLSRARLHSAPPPPPGLENYAHLCASHGIPVKTAAGATPFADIHLRSVPAATCEYRPSGNPQCHRCRPSYGTWRFFQSLGPGSSMVKFGQAKPDGLGHIDTADSDLMHHHYRLSVGPALRNHTNIIPATCGRFHAVILQEASDHVPHISDQFIAYTGNTDLAILLNKDTFEPDPMVFAFKEDSTSKGTWGMILLIVRGLRRPSLSGTPTVTFCSVHIHSDAAKKRDASTDLLRRLHGYVQQHNVDFIGGDFNMSESFQHPTIRFCGDLVRWKSRIVSALGFSSCQSVHMSGVWIHTAATSMITQRLASDLVTTPLTFLYLYIFVPPTNLAPTASCAMDMRNKEGLSANISNTSVRGDDVHDRDVAHQSHMSAHLVPSSPITCESPRASCFAPH